MRVVYGGSSGFGRYRGRRYVFISRFKGRRVDVIIGLVSLLCVRFVGFECLFLIFVLDLGIRW